MGKQYRLPSRLKYDSRTITQYLQDHKPSRLHTHDAMTGLISRRHFESLLADMSRNAKTLGLIYCDINLLKFSNDVLGVAQGDLMIQAAARIVRSVFPEETPIARIGGDEFGILLSNVSKEDIQQATRNIQGAINAYIDSNSPLMLSMAVGYSFHTQPINAQQLLVEAECDMYHQKVLQTKQVREKFLPWLFNELHIRGLSGHGHGRRAQRITHSLGVKLNFSEYRLDYLVLAAQFHDIGKIKVPPQILYKPDQLNEEETRIIRWHSESGYRIALSIPYLAPVADWILKHHERWDGKGYPLGLKGEAIPTESQIIALADTFDAMTNNRPYRSAMPVEAAIEEIKRSAGSQFDPYLVKLFLELYEEDPASLLTT